jgi:hypothetical protein
MRKIPMADVKNQVAENREVKIIEIENGELARQDEKKITFEAGM